MALFVCEGYTDDSLHCVWKEDGICGGYNDSQSSLAQMNDNVDTW